MKNKGLPIVTIAAAIISSMLAVYFTNLQHEPEALSSTAVAENVEIEGFSQSELLTGINKQRAAHDKKSLTLNAELTRSAQSKAEDIANKGYWSHVAPDGTQPWKYMDDEGYDYLYAGENLAKCFKTPAAAIKGWMNSPSHRANLLGNYQDTGFGIAQKTNGCIVVVEHFGTEHGEIK